MRKWILSLLIILLYQGFASAQKTVAQNPDSLFSIAQKQAFKNHFADAEKIMVPLVAKYPKNSDYTIFYGSLCSWMHKYDSSKAILRQVIAAEPKNLDAYDALTYSEIWSKDDSMAIIDCKKALLIPIPKPVKGNAAAGAGLKEDFILKIAEAEMNLQKFPPAYAIVDSILKKNAIDTNAKNLRTDIYTEALQKTADSLFDTAQHQTARRIYPLAEKIAKKLTLQYPANSDYKILWARLLSFRKKIDTSKIMLYQVIKAEPKNLEAYDAVADDELISGHFKRSDSLCDTALRLPVKGDRTSLVITKASDQDNMTEYYEGLTTLDTLVKKHPDNKEAVSLDSLIRIHIFAKKADSLLVIAQKEVLKKNYAGAQAILDSITKWFPDNTDYKIFEGRVYSYQAKYDTAISIISGVIKKEPHNMDAYDALTDAELWKKNFPRTITDIDKALADSLFRGYPSMIPVKKDSLVKGKDTAHASIPDTTHISPVADTSKRLVKLDTAKPFVNKDSNAAKFWPMFMLKRANAQFAMEDYKGALATLDTLHHKDSLNKDSLHKEANKLLVEDKIKLLKNTIQLGYLNNYFSPGVLGPWNYAWLQYTRNFLDCPVSAKITYGSVNNPSVPWHQGLQFELGAYPKITNTTSADAAVAYSNNFAVFPQWQISADLIQKLPLGFEASLGAMYMHFIDVVDEPPTPPQDIWIIDPYIGYYFGTDKWQFSYHPYFAYKAPNIYLTHTAVFRRFLGNSDTWVSLYGTYGTQPFVDYFNPSPVPITVEMVGVDYQTRLPHNWLIWPMVSYEYVEYYPSNWTNMYYFQVIITKRF